MADKNKIENLLAPKKNGKISASAIYLPPSSWLHHLSVGVLLLLCKWRWWTLSETGEHSGLFCQHRDWRHGWQSSVRISYRSGLMRQVGICVGNIHTWWQVNCHVIRSMHQTELLKSDFRSGWSGDSERRLWRNPAVGLLIAKRTVRCLARRAGARTCPWAPRWLYLVRWHHSQ